MIKWLGHVMRRNTKEKYLEDLGAQNSREKVRDRDK